MDVGAWLRGLGLGQYEPAFRDNDIDARVLPALTADELKEIGVTSVGHRRLLLQAIAALSAPPAPAAPATAAVEAIAVPAAHAPSQAERRQLTVMFVDLVGSTALAARLDPEEMGELIRAYQNLVAGEVTRFEGHVAKYMGDGVLAYFGWPRAHEDDAERAVRAGRAIAATVPGLATLAGEPPAARIGIATGPAMVGDLIGSEEARERTVVGETPNLAARLQQLAEPGAVVIAEGTRRLVGDLFAYRSLAATRLKGFVEPLTVYHVLGEGAAEGRFEAMHTTGLTPLVGREQELALLLDRWERAKESEGQVILLSGEAGIGKSRLVRALRERLESDPHTALGHFCSSYHASSALHPVIGLLEREAGLRREDLPKHQLDKLEAMLALAVEDVHTAASLLADLLAVPVSEGRYPPLAMSPQQKKERTFQALLDLLAGLAVREPVLALYEDVHWADPTTLELLGRVVDRAQRLSVLVLVTFRPEFVPPWAGHGHVTALSLSRLGRRQAATVVEQVAGDKVIPADVLDQILARTDGVPLFVEELTKTVLESGLLRDQGDHYELDGPLPPLAIPATLQDSLMARLDRLAPIKEVAQVGAAIGRQFSYELLAAVASLPDDRLQDALAQLAEVELVFRRGTPPQASYSFKHALVRDAAYASLLRSKRQQLHARIARALEERFPETVEAKPELLARHCTEAGLAEQAIDYWHRAGQRALARSAMAEAAAQLTKGLEVLAGLPDGPERRRRELGLQLVLGPALIAAKGVAAPGTGRTYARACELCRELGDVPELFPALYGRAVVHLQRGELAAALGVAHELLRLAEERGDAAARVTGYRMIGSALSQLGRPVESRDHLETALALYDPVRDRSSALVYALDSRGVCLAWLSHVLLAPGYPEQALARSSEALAYARELAHPNTLAFALSCDCILHQLLRDRPCAQAQAEALIALATEQGFPVWLAAGTVVRGWALAHDGRAEDGIAEIRRGLADYRATGAEMWSPYFLHLLAEVLGRAGRAAAGLDLAAEAVGRAERIGARWIEAELHRLRGELLLALPAPERHEAAACFRQALAGAREQGARLWELRVGTSLARLWRDQGEQHKARDLLAPVYGWFTEGLGTPDLQDAKALLDELR